MAQVVFVPDSGVPRPLAGLSNGVIGYASRRFAMTLVPRLIAAARLGLTAVIIAACGTSSSYLSSTGSTVTLMAGWEQHFTLEWTAESESEGARRVSGYAYDR